ncbi:kynurenine formamidase [Spinactinospora alkalitolerans]|uniref:Kynurenine formamidase n=1 Tax=Spinactinospora alkalitolerans TaxID=687207 RepID=A0A852TPS9_9ACTN|nr:cyclase family protein [Spinactinospora alkalitolerans]NYE45968.1 kynurenine formamidase [Spinactinospora alkalitolerans]
MTDALLAAVRGGVRTIDLAQPLFTGMPSSPNHPGFRMTLIRRHGDMVRPDGGSAANELIITGGHVGTHVDALAHVSHEGCLHGGLDAAETTVNGRFTEHGIDRMEPLVRRGVLLDVAAAHGTACLEPGYGVTAADLEKAAERGGAEPGPGDVALVRTGWAVRFDDAEAYLGQADGVPGVTEEAAHWLAERRIAAAGADTTAFEQIPAGKGHSVLPVHRVLLVENGIHIIEHMALEDLSRESVGEFVFVMSPLKIIGGTGSPVRPLAVVGA